MFYERKKRNTNNYNKWKEEEEEEEGSSNITEQTFISTFIGIGECQAQSIYSLLLLFWASSSSSAV